MAGSLARGFPIAAFLLLFGIVWRPPLQAPTRVSLDVHNADVRETLRLIAEVGGLNVVMDPDVKGTITLRLQEVPVEDALQIVLNATGLVQVCEGTTVEILSREAWLQQRKASRRGRSRRRR